jgi:dihydroflavonol-4-reductase
MKIFMIGGTGLLGSAGAKELIKRGHQVTSLALPPVPEGSDIPKEMELTLGNYMELSDEDLRNYFKDCEGFIFAAGVDERVEAKKGESVYEMFKKYNNVPLERMLKIAKECGVKKVVLLGSYFAYFAKEWKELELAKHHPYIRSRVEQEQIALSFAEDGQMDVAVLELPYIFGAQPGRKPVWLFVAEMIRNTKGKNLMYPKGGTTMVTVRQVGEAIAGALERNKGGKAYPVGWFNMEWKQWLEIFSKHMGEEKKVVTIPTFLYRMNAKKMAKQLKENNMESGLEMVEFVKLMTANAFIDKDIIEKELGVTTDDIDKAIGESARLCVDILDKKTEVIDMKAE